MECQSRTDGVDPSDRNQINQHGGASSGASASSGRPFAARQGRSLSTTECAKVASIWTACESTRPIGLLTTMATSNAGLVNDEVRRLACESMATGALWSRLIHESRANSAGIRSEDHSSDTILPSVARSTATQG